jgi:hypothetical protein
VGKFALIQHQRYAHAKQFKRANRMLKKCGPISAASSATSVARSRAMAGSKQRLPFTWVTNWPPLIVATLRSYVTHNCAASCIFQ